MSPIIKRALPVFVLGLLLSTPAVAQRSTTFAQGNQSLVGPQIGVATNNLNFFIGAQFSLPVADRIDVYPSFDYYFPSNSYGAFGVNVTVWGINAEARYWPKLNMENSGLYVGGGLNITHVGVSVGGIGGSTTNAGLGLLGGWDFKSVSWHPFAQIHAVIGNADRIEFGGGVNFKL